SGCKLSEVLFDIFDIFLARNFLPAGASLCVPSKAATLIAHRRRIRLPPSQKLLRASWCTENYYT
ncbi:MAG: hypothetical protein KJ692_03915, partial [Verrucomicrobia bacterium]|nr:hypothetical protein [Verrucomicrobiota bacterium]